MVFFFDGVVAFKPQKRTKKGRHERPRKESVDGAVPRLRILATNGDIKWSFEKLEDGGLNFKIQKED